ncbi:Similar to Regulatory protein GAL4; acc. no. P04386 [Pyronema omphalodes CBS 100304]|uniref:Similar to Regulatory protein GAL4 acc. no. P04386 n=1 Tax=Pyronema omphalodes (strain CBS 100304) TaxID=1076935 RepID=U4L049_PYROM|nr:Similar to Regulatory protein GAL4; acc. no. P04386 [Pyronema omphalodes CBS 100304]
MTHLNMDDLHERCQRLQTLLQNIDPSINIEDLIGNGVDSTTRYGHDRKQSSGAESSGVATPEEEEGGNESDTEEDANPCRFEWHEGEPGKGGADGNALADGMAGLNIDSREVGYLGRSSAAALLRHVYRLLKAHERTTGTAAGSDFEYILTSPMPSPKISSAEKGMYLTWNEDQLINSYFRYYHSSYPIVHEALFREKVSKWKSNELKAQPNTHWHTLYRMVLVTGAMSSVTNHNDPSALVDTKLYEMVKETFFRLEFFSYGTLEGVQALALMGAYLQKRDNPNTGYNCLGMAMRMALGLGLHRDVSESKGPTLGMEIRRRIWWTLYILDVGASITFGRPTIPSDKVFTKIPINVIDYHITDRNALLPPPCSEVTVYSGMIAHAHLSILMNRIHLNFFIHPRSLSSCRLPLSRELISKFDEQITRWEKALPPYFADRRPEQWFAAPKAVVEWKAANLRMLMYKCFLDCLSYSPSDRPAPTTPPMPEARQTHIALLPEVRKCLTFALSTISSIRKFTNAHNPLWHGVGWYATYYVFQAALVLVTAILSVPRDASVAVWKDGVLDAIRCLRILETSTANASRVAVVVRWCLSRIEGGEVQRPCVGIFDNPVEECRITVNEFRQQMEMEYNGIVSGGIGVEDWNQGYMFGQGGFGGTGFFGQYEVPTPPEMDVPVQLASGMTMAGEFWGDALQEAGLGLGLGMQQHTGQQLHQQHTTHPQAHPQAHTAHTGQHHQQHPQQQQQSYSRMQPGYGV